MKILFWKIQKRSPLRQQHANFRPVYAYDRGCWPAFKPPSVIDNKTLAFPDAGLIIIRTFSSPNVNERRLKMFPLDLHALAGQNVDNGCPKKWQFKYYVSAKCFDISP